MTDFWRNDIQVCINLPLGEEKPSSCKIFKKTKNEASHKNYFDASIVHNTKEPSYVRLTIYYEPYKHIFELLKMRLDLGENILDYILSKPSEEKFNFPDIIDFSKSNLVELVSSSQWQHDKKPVILILDNLQLIEQSRFVGDGIFKLTENVYQHIADYITYGQLGNHELSDTFIYANKIREVSFGEVQMILSFRHSYDQTFSKFGLKIDRRASLTLNDSSEELTDMDIENYGNDLCFLMSFYWQKRIDYFVATLRKNDKDDYRTRELYKYSDHYIDESTDFFLKNRYETLYDFIESLSYDKVITHKSLLIDLIPRLIKSKSVDKVSEFMLLYNIIEKIRNYCINEPIENNKLEIKEEFKFKLSKKNTKDFIKNKIKEIKEIVEDEDIEDFDSIASDKVSFIKKTRLIDQFGSLINYLNLKEEDYSINFVELIKIRNTIYHGNELKVDVKPYNKEMVKLIYDLVLELIQ